MALAEEFSISEDAVRRDLRALAAEGKCKRVYGGALPLSVKGGDSFQQRLGSDAKEKDALARAALPLLAGAKTIFLDNGTTNLALARDIHADRSLTLRQTLSPSRQHFWNKRTAGSSRSEERSIANKQPPSARRPSEKPSA
jgi:DeoR/GlpR family transcriptional regulator of sugar metabolism